MWVSSLHPKFSLFYRQSHSPRNLREACVSRNTRLSLARCVRPTDHQKLGSVSSHPKDKHSFWLQMRISCSNCSQLQRYSTSSVKPEGRTSTHLPPCWGAKPRKSCEETGDEYSMVSWHLREELTKTEPEFSRWPLPEVHVFIFFLADFFVFYWFITINLCLLIVEGLLKIVQFQLRLVFLLWGVVGLLQSWAIECFYCCSISISPISVISPWSTETDFEKSNR